MDLMIIVYINNELLNFEKNIWTMIDQIGEYRKIYNFRYNVRLITKYNQMDSITTI